MVARLAILVHGFHGIETTKLLVDNLR